MAGLETLVAEQFITAKLKADTLLVAALADGTNGIWTDVPATTAKYPLVQIVHNTSTDLWHLGRYLVWSDHLYIVRGVAMAQSFTTLRTIVRRINAALESTDGSTADGTVFGVARLRPFRMSETDGNLHYRYLGAFFRVFSKDTEA
jgi:hypothetical protein